MSRALRWGFAREGITGGKLQGTWRFGSMNVVLIGFSGCGKSSVGRALAGQLGWEFVDTDAEVERTAGRRIHEIFAEEGEATFRMLERSAVESALRGEHRVVAVGGGAVVDPTNRQAIREGNLVVLLDANVDIIQARLERAMGEEPRPMLAKGGAERIASLKAARDPVYRETAHVTIATDDATVEEVTLLVAEAVRRVQAGLEMGATREL